MMNRTYFFVFLIILAVCLGFVGKGFPTVTKLANSYEIYITKAITNTKILPDTWPIPGPADKSLTIQACRGEYEPATFIIHALQDIKGLVITSTDLHSDLSSIPASAVDIRVVKYWFQAGILWNDNKQRLLIPELLLKDDNLVKVDLKDKINYLRTTNHIKGEKYISISGQGNNDLMHITPSDSANLQPVNIDDKTNKQFWVTVKVPENAPPGQYEGKIKVSPANAPTKEITLQVRVLPFTLENPTLIYSMFYRGQLTRYSLEYLPKLKKVPIIDSDFKSPQQYYAEMQNLKAHGVDYPSIQQKDDELFNKELEIRQKAGLPKEYAFTACVSMRELKTPDHLEAFKHRAEKWLKMTKGFGYEKVYFFGIDEAQGELLKSQHLVWGIVHQIGGKVYTTINPGDFELVGKLLDLAVVPNRPDPQEARKYHQVGHLIFNYGYPQSGAEDPVIYRRKYGLSLWKGEYDGAMDYAYQHCVGGHIWNDFNHPRSRPVVVAYPTIDGVIDTIQWEGFREGVDDVRYLSTLLKFIKQAKQRKPDLAAEAQNWVDHLDPGEDLDESREQMIDWILKLQ